MKYIIVHNPVTDSPQVVMFSEGLPHSMVASSFQVIHSAGFCNQYGDVWGRSDGLGIKSHPADSAMVKVALTVSFNPKP